MSLPSKINRRSLSESMIDIFNMGRYLALEERQPARQTREAATPDFSMWDPEEVCQESTVSKQN
jgi:hypothetical protein